MKYRKLNMKTDLSKKYRTIGYTKFTIKGLIEVINNLENNYSMYGYIYNLNKREEKPKTEAEKKK